MLQTVVELRNPPIGLKEPSACEIFVLRDLAVALSACIYQSLCDSDTFSVKQASTTDGIYSPGMETLARLNASCQSSHLMANAANQRRRKYSTDEPLMVSTPPPKWPGVTNLRALLAREKDEDTPRLNVLLCEAFVGTFMSLLVYSLSTCDCHILYRLSGQKFTNDTWATLYGGGVKKLLRKATSNLHAAQQVVASQMQQESLDSPTSDGSVWTAVTSLTKQRVKLNMKLLGMQSSPSGSSPNMKEDKPTYREQFVPPDMSMVSYFLIKPKLRGDNEEDGYDSADSTVSDLESDEEEEDVFADPLSNDPKVNTTSDALKKHRRENTEHSNPHSYSWAVMRLAIVKIAQIQLKEFIDVAGIEVAELPVASPLIHATLRTLAMWQEILRDELENRGPASVDYIPGCFIESEAKGPAIHKYRSLMEKNNTPFSPVVGLAAPARRLWNYLVRQEPVQDIFIRAVFGKRKQASSVPTDSSGHINSSSSSVAGGDSGTPGGADGSHHNSNNQHLPEPVRIIHKDQEQISAFCLNLVNPGLLSLSTPREVQEMDIALLLESPNWMEDECEFDIMNLSRDPETLPASGFLVIQTSNDK